MSNTLQVGETYTSENGSEWECIFIRDGKAWLIGIYPDGSSGSAYAFDIDGTGICLCNGAYNIKWGPKRETVTRALNYDFDRFIGQHYPYDNGNLNITFDLIDGTPDWTTAKVTPCD